MFLSAILGVLTLTAIIIMFLPSKQSTWPRWIALIGSSIALVITAILFIQYNMKTAGLQFVETLPLLPALNISYDLALDGMALTMVLLTSIIIFCGVLASWDLKNRAKEFFALLLILVVGVFGVFMARDLFVFFLFYEIAVLPMYLLIGIWGTGDKEYSAMKLTIYLMVGSAFILAAILALYFYGDQSSFNLTQLSQKEYSRTFQIIVFPALFVGFGILAGFWPFHTWSPDGHASAPAAVSMLHAGVLMKLGAFGIIRLGLELLPQGAAFWSPYLIIFTLVNIVYGSLVAMSQTDIKYVIAYSSVSHMGIVLLGICTLNPIALNGAVLQMFSHGIMTALFFALVGMIYSRTKTRIISELGGLAKPMSYLAFAFIVGGLVSLGLPGFSGFVAELLVFIGTFKTYPLWAVIAVSGILFTAIYVLRVVQKMFFGELKTNFTNITDANLVEKTCLAILMLVLLIVGIYPSSLVDLINTSIAPLSNLWEVLP